MNSLMKFLSRTSSQRLLSYGAVVFAVVAIAGAVAVLMSRNSAADEAAMSHKDTGQASLASEDFDTKALTLGSAATIGPDYRVAITKVTLHQGSGTPFLVASVKTKNTGRDATHPQKDLSLAFAKKDRPTSKESTCQLDLATLKATDQSTLSVGDVQTYAFCINLPSTDLKDGRISVSANGTADHAAWSTSGKIPTVTSTATPEIHLAAPPGPDPKIVAKSLKDLKKQIKKAKKAEKTVDKQIKAYEALPDHKKKKLKKIKKDREKLHDAIKQMEEMAAQLEK
jgi:hypothetical protein